MRRIFRLWRLTGGDLRLLWAALRHPNRPSWLIPATLALLILALDPFNFAIPILGVVDDLFLLPWLLHGLAKIAAYAIAVSTSPSRNDRVVSVQRQTTRSPATSAEVGLRSSAGAANVRR